MNPTLPSNKPAWPLSQPSPKNNSASTPLPRRSSRKPSSLVVYPPPPSLQSNSTTVNMYYQQHHPQPTTTASSTTTSSSIMASQRKYMHNIRQNGVKSGVNMVDGVFLASPPPTATRLPNSDMLRMPRLHQTFDFVSGKQQARTKGTKRPPFLLPSHRVGFAEYGDLEHGYPTFVIGGHGCSRLVGIMFEDLAQRHGLRMIWPERPGYGLSEECSPQKLNALDWAEVIIQLADHLGIEKFSIIAQSVGTVFAMATAHQYSSRIVGPMCIISPWVSTQQANTFKWTRRLPASLVTKTLSFAMDVMWLFNKVPDTTDSSEDTQKQLQQQQQQHQHQHQHSQYTPPFSPASLTNEDNDKRQDEENEFLASLEGDSMDLPTDFPPHRPLRHMVRPRHVSLYVAMNKCRMMEPYQSGQLGDVLVALEKYHDFGFNYDGQLQKVPISAVWGDKDSLIPQRAVDCFANQIRDIRLKILEGEGHDLIWKEGVMAWAIRSIGERWRAVDKR